MKIILLQSSNQIGVLVSKKVSERNSHLFGVIMLFFFDGHLEHF